MGKKSRKQPGSKTGAGAQSAGSFNLVRPFAVKGTSFPGQNKLSAKLGNTSTIPVHESGTWRVYIRRCDHWLTTTLLKKKRRSPDPKFRPWWVNFIVVHPSSAVKVHSILIQDDDAVAKNPMVHLLTPTMFMAALLKVVLNAKSRPCKLIFYPAEGGRFRFASIKEFLETLTPILPQGLTVESLKPVELEEHAHSSCSLGIDPQFGGAEDDEETQLYYFKDRGMVKYVEDCLNQTEIKYDKGTQLGRAVEDLSQVDMRRVSTLHYHIMPEILIIHTIPGMVYCQGCVQCNLIELSLPLFLFVSKMMKACREFHDARPWENMSNFDVLTITVPDLYDHDDLGSRKSAAEAIRMEPLLNRPPITYVAVVAGNGSWDARGVHLYKSWSDMVAVSTNVSAPIEKDSHSFMFFKRWLIPFKTLDYIEELGLDISSTGGTVDDAYPLLFSTKSGRHNGSTMVNMLAKLSTPPPKEEIPSMSLATMAITKFATSKEYCWRKKKNEVIHCTQEPVEIDIDLTSEGRPAGSVVAKVQYRWNTHTSMMSVEAMDNTMSGGKDSCNFCQKPKAVLKREEKTLRTCSRCQAIYYCSRQCQRNDWIRHKMDCRQV